MNKIVSYKIVFCKNCQHMNDGYCDLIDMYVWPEDYCYRGESEEPAEPAKIKEGE